MQPEWFDKAREEVRAEISRIGRLTYGARRRLLDIQKHHVGVTEKEARLFRVLMEVACADHVKHIWEETADQWFVQIPLVLLDIAKGYIGKDIAEEDPIRKLPSLLWRFGEAIGTYEWNEPKSLFFYDPHRQMTREKKFSAHASVAACQAAIASIILEDRKLCQSLPADWEPDTYDRCAVDWAEISVCACFPSRQTKSEIRELCCKFWHWYIDDAFVWSVHEVNRRMTQIGS